MGRPPYSAIASLPRDFPYGHQPEPKGWAEYLAWESSDPDTDLTVPAAAGRYVQINKPGIMPCTRETFKDDKYKTFGTFRLRCDASGHETIVHKCVVREQSKWLRDSVDRSNSHDEVPIRVPGHISWWQVAWALEYMYEGRVPGFHLLAGEDQLILYPDRPARSIAWGLLELWDAGHFFGLGGLTARAEGAFVNYFLDGITQAINSPGGAPEIGASQSEGPASGDPRYRRPEGRVAHEFRFATWRIFGDPDVLPRDYFRWHFTRYGVLSENLPGQASRALQAWERAMFDRTDAPVGGIADHSRWATISYPKPRHRDIFSPQMTGVCSVLSTGGLFELHWFRRMLSLQDQLWTCPDEFRTALTKRMGESFDSWLLTLEEVESSSDEELITLEGVEPSGDDEQQ